MEYLYQTARQAMNSMLGEYHPLNLAAKLSVDNAHVYRAKNGDYTATLIKNLQRLGYIPPPEPRVRWSPDCTPELREEIRAECDLLEITNGDMLFLMWLAWLESKELDRWLTR